VTCEKKEIRATSKKYFFFMMSMFIKGLFYFSTFNKNSL